MGFGFVREPPEIYREDDPDPAPHWTLKVVGNIIPLVV